MWPLKDALEVRGELSARILAPALRYLEERHGAGHVDAMLARAGVPASRARDGHAWLLHHEFEAVLAAVRDEVASDEEFRQACVHRMAEAYGPLLYVVRATSVKWVYRLLARTLFVVSRASHYEFAELGEAQVWLRYTSRLPESRLMCLSRIAQLTWTPSVFGLGAASLEERQCLGRGEPCCEYVLRWPTK